MELKLLFTLFVLLVNVLYASLQSNFYSEVEADQLIYTVVRIPRYAYYHEVSIWADTSILNPVALLRYDGLPTMELYDMRADIPFLPGVLRLIDHNPTQSVLYVGIYGGVELHRYRYFAGSPSSILVGVESKADVCDDEFQRGNNCTFVDSLGSSIKGRSTPATIKLGSHSLFVVPVPSNLEGIQVEIKYQDLWTSLCHYAPFVNGTDNILMSMDIYLDQRAEEENSGRRVMYLSQADLCMAEYEHYSERTLSMLVQRPLAGAWTVDVYIGINGTHISAQGSHANARISKRTRYNSTTSMHKQNQWQAVDADAISIPIQITSKLLSCPQSFTTNTDDTDFSGTFNASLCTAPVVSMYSLRTPMVAEGFFALHGGPALLATDDNSVPPASHHQQSQPLREKKLLDSKRDEQAFAVFTASISPQVQELAVGGGMVLQLQVKLPDTATHINNAEFSQMMNSVHFQVAVRFGGLPQDPTVYPAVEGGEEWEVLSANAFVLSTRDGAVIADETATLSQASDDDDNDCSANPNCRQRSLIKAQSTAVSMMQYGMDFISALRSHLLSLNKADKDHISGSTRPNLAEGGGVQSTAHVRTYSWVITRPALPALYSTALGGSAGETLYIRVSRERPSVGASDSSGSKQHQEQQQQQREYGILHTLNNDAPRGRKREAAPESNSPDDAASLSYDFLVSASLVFEPCPQGSCVHGTCFTQPGDIAAFSCACRYPWAGESCDELSVSFWFFVVQILFLVLSNAAMAPAIMCCLVENLSFLTSLLSLSAGASAFYHLCDTDVYCIGGLSFQSLQVLDVLFSVSAIASVLLLYGPISRSTHSALSVLCVGLLVAPVSNQPTSPVNILQAMAFSASVVAIGWLYKSGQCPSKACGVDLRWCFQCFVVLSGDPLSCDVALGYRDKAGRSAVGRRGLTGSVLAVGGDSPLFAVVRHIPLSDADVEAEDDVEMTTSSHYLQQPRSEDTSSRGNADGTTEPVGADMYEEASASAAHQSVIFTVIAALRNRKLRMPLCGAALGATGLLCFALQGRDNYYFLHSLWHIFMMISAYLLVQGRVDLYRVDS